MPCPHYLSSTPTDILLPLPLQPNAYTYSVLLKALGEHGQWQLAEAVFGHLEQQVLAARARAATVRQPQSPRGTKQDGVQVEGGPSPVHRGGLSSHPLGADSGTGASWSRPSQLNGISVDLNGGSLAADGGSFAFSGLGSPADGLLQPQVSGLVQRPLRSATAAAMAEAGFVAPSLTLSDERHDPLLVSRHALESAAASSPSSASYGGIQGREPPVSGRQPQQHGSHPGPSAPLINEFVCGALMLAYERAGLWAEAVSVISRSRALGLRPNTIMFNTGISAAGKAGQLDVAERLFAMVTHPDAITHETLVASYGMCGRPEEAEAAMRKMIQAGFRPRCYAYCGLIAAHSLTGDYDSALVGGGWGNEMRAEYLAGTDRDISAFAQLFFISTPFFCRLCGSACSRMEPPSPCMSTMRSWLHVSVPVT